MQHFHLYHLHLSLDSLWRTQIEGTANTETNSKFHKSSLELNSTWEQSTITLFVRGLNFHC